MISHSHLGGGTIKNVAIARLVSLTRAVRSEVGQAISDEGTPTNREAHYRPVVEEFEYSEKYQGPRRWHNVVVEVPSWSAALHRIVSHFEKDKKYLQALEAMESLSRSPDVSKRGLSNLVLRVARDVVRGESPSDTTLEGLADLLIRDLRGESFEGSVKARLTGLVLLCGPVEFTAGDERIGLRPIIREDCEESTSIEMLGLGMVRPRSEHGTSVLKIDCPVHDMNDVQGRLFEAVTILRLFGVGSVSHLWYDLEGESLTRMMGGRVTSGRGLHADDKIVIRTEDVYGLKRFWRALQGRVPRNLVGFGDHRIDPLSIAYSRYVDGLMGDSAIEKRISSAVMGLEAIYLGDERTELKFRLAVRAVQVLRHVGHDAVALREQIKEAYDIRSSFVHGGHLTSKDRKRIQKQHGDPANIARSALDWLRKSIVISILLQREKEDFLDLLDDAMVHDSARDQVKGLVVSGAEEAGFLPTRASDVG